MENNMDKTITLFGYIYTFDNKKDWMNKYNELKKNSVESNEFLWTLFLWESDWKYYLFDTSNFNSIQWEIISNVSIIESYKEKDTFRTRRIIYSWTKKECNNEMYCLGHLWEGYLGNTALWLNTKNGDYVVYDDYYVNRKDTVEQNNVWILKNGEYEISTISLIKKKFNI